MKGKSCLKKLISNLMILAMVLISLSNAVPKQANAAVDSKELAATYLNATKIYLHLGNEETGTYNFNINESAKTKGATYIWYVKMDKGNPECVTINARNGVVTAKEVGTAYIRCKVTLADGTILRPEAKVIVRNNITEVDISNLPADMTITAGSDKDFNRVILNTEAGKGKTSSGITRWEVDGDTAGVEKATDAGVVSPTKAGEFRIRAVSFQSVEKYKLWLDYKILNKKYITAASSWYTIKVVAPEVSVTPTPTPTQVPSTGGGGTYIPPTITVNAITITSAGDTNTVIRGETLQLNAIISPANASDQSIVWSVATLSRGTATINSITGLLTATGIGTVKVTATNLSSGVIGTKDITITAPSNNYTALGDSITYGMSAEPNHGYVNLFYNYLKSTEGNENLSLLNLGVPGEKSSDLLYMLQNDAVTRDAVSKAKVISVSIGGNNLLAPVINAFANAFHLNPTSATFANDLALAIANPNSSQIINSVIADLQSNLGSGVQQFADDWIGIIGTIKLLAPHADVYVMTLYNPFNPTDPLYPIFDPVIQGINSIICTPNLGYRVADVYNDFNNYRGVEPLVNFGISTGNLDPHPTTKGHEVIYQSHIEAEEIIKKPVITEVSIKSNNADNTKAMIGDIITLTFKTDEPVTKLSNFKINGSNPDTFTNVGNVYTATHLVDDGDLITGMPATFQINVKNAAGIYSLTVEATTDHSSVTIIDKMPRITNISIASNSAKGSNVATIGDIITLTFTSDEAITKLNNFKINGSNPDTFTNSGNVYTATHLVDAGDVITGAPATFQINVKNAAGIYSPTIEATSDGSSVTIVDEKPVITDVSITSNNANNTKAMIGDTITLTFKTDEPVTKLGNFKINGSNPDTFTHVGNLYTATHLVDAGDMVTGLPATFQINVKNTSGIYSLTIEETTDGSSVTIIDKMPVITSVRIVSNNADITKAMIGDTITLTFITDEPVTKLGNFKINGSNPDTFTNVDNVYTATHLVDAGDVLTGLPVTFQINVKNAAGIYSLTVEATTDGSSVTIISNSSATFNGIVFVSDFDRNLINNAVLSGAKVTLTEKLPSLEGDPDSFEAFSDEEGQFTINNLSLGTYILEVTKEGYVSYRNENFSISETNNTMNIYLDAGVQTSTLSGIVTIADADTISNNNVVLPNITVSLTKIGSSSTSPRTAVTDNNGRYTFSDLACGLYEISISSEGYLPVNSEISITNIGSINYNITLEAIQNSYEGNGVANGVIINALTGNGVEAGLTLTVFRGYNMTNGTMVANTLTSSNGEYSFELPSGNYTVYVTDNRENPTIKYSNGTFIIKVLGNTTISNQNGQVTPIITSGEIRIVLSWGATPRDLDSHLVGPTNEGTNFHVCYYNEEFYQNDVLMANLDVDDTSSYGPETTTIYHQEDGVYKFSVHDFSNGGSHSSTELGNSGAYVRVYIGGSVLTYYVPNLEGTLWDVFEYNSVTGTITVLNRMSYNEPDEGNQNLAMFNSTTNTRQKDYEINEN